MAVTVASLVTKMGYDDSELRGGLGAASGLLGSAMGGLTSIIEAGAIAAATAFGAIAESYMKVQDALTPVMTLTGQNTEQFKEMSASIKDVIASSPRDANDIGMAAYKILSSGITDATQANLALVASNQLALAGLGSVTQASDLISSAMAVWKDSALSADDAAKTFFGTIQVGKTTTAELASGFGTIAPLAAIAGLSLNDLMSATAALTVTGMPAATAYTNLRNILTNILKPTKQAAEEAKSLGIEFNTSALKGEGLRAFLQDIWAKTEGDPDKIAKLFGNVRGLTGAIALMGPEADQYATDIDSINAKGQLLGERAAEVASTFSNRIKEMKNAVMVYLADLGQKGLDWFSAKWKVWGDDISANASHFKDNLIAIFVAVKNHFVDFASGWMSSSADSPSGFFENLASIARGVYEEVLKLFRVLKTSFLDFVTGWSDGGEGSPSGFWQNLGSQAEQVGQGILDLFHDIKVGFLDFITRLGEQWIR
jgi:TP901 family phage tail tape measure protein